jgi:putative ABC transport system ATP-binding protein
MATIGSIEARGLWKTYAVDGGNEFHALRDVDLRIEGGEHVAIVGPSGSGKSTLLQLLGALDVPTRGEVLYDGEPSASLGERALARLRSSKLGFVFQSFNLVPRVDALANVMLPMSFAPRRPSRAQREARARDLLARVGLAGKERATPAQLSGGQKQRVAIARALANEPEVILADEPTGNLDQGTGSDILRLFTELNREGRTVIVVTHDASIAARADRIVRVLDGRVSEGSSEGIVTFDVVREEGTTAGGA